MKVFFSIVLAGALFVAPGIQDTINIALKTGDAATLTKYFSANIDLTVNNTESVYSQAQAGQILKSFFEKNKPTGFRMNHQGNSQDGSNYVIGTLTTATGQFQVYYFLKAINGNMLIQKLRVVAENGE